jgi:hypothetical protein
MRSPRNRRNVITRFVAKSADCLGARAEGNSVLLALDAFARQLEWIVVDGDGGLFPLRSSEAFQYSYFADLVEGWAQDEVFVLSVSYQEVTLFPR